jgi:hypothetical protein
MRGKQGIYTVMKLRTPLSPLLFPALLPPQLQREIQRCEIGAPSSHLPEAIALVRFCAPIDMQKDL